MSTYRIGVIIVGYMLIQLKYLLSFVSRGDTPPIDLCYNGIIPWVTTKDLNDSFITTTQKKIIPDALKNAKYHLFLCPQNTLIVSLIGSMIKLGILSIEATINENCLQVG